MESKNRSGEVRTATSSDVDQLVVTLTRAFDTDPVVNWMLRQDAKRTEGFDALFRACLDRLSLRHGEVLTTRDCAGGALWYPPGTSKIGFVQQLGLLPAMIRGTGLRGLGRMIGIMDLLDRNHPEKPHYYLQFIGVDPDQQGRGLGAALMRPALERCDQQACGAFLENTKESNLVFYERFGFSVTQEVHLEPDGPTVWLMWRDPRLT